MNIMKYLKYVVMLPEYLIRGILFVIDYIAEIGSFVLHIDTSNGYSSYGEYIWALLFGLILSFIALILTGFTFLCIFFTFAILTHFNPVAVFSTIAVIVAVLIITYLHYKEII